MKETKLKSSKPIIQSNRWRAVDPERFKSNFNEACPGYEGLCKGESVKLDSKNKMVKYLVNNKFIVKEN